ncbi:MULTISPECIES: hypothetical protein [unclassified Nonomuraea]|uniref:hypothetical protein n=1 Tax=unclassified Nonomuraea TaxID=2593643 RepID=UPI0033F68215
MSAVPALPARWFDHALRVTAVTLWWLAAMLATALLCRPTPGTEVLVPVVVAVAVAVVMLVGRPVGGSLLLFNVAIFAMAVWGEVGGAVLVVSTIAALASLPVPALQPAPGDLTIRARSRWARIEASRSSMDMRPGRCASLAASAGERASRSARARAKSWPADASAFARVIGTGMGAERGGLVTCS